jgi:hypothetical protein
MQAFNNALHTVVVVVVHVLLKLTIGAAPNDGAPSPTSRPRAVTEIRDPPTTNITAANNLTTSLTGCSSKVTRHTTPSKRI